MSDSGFDRRVPELSSLPTHSEAATAVFGVVDIGSNAVRARIAEVTAPRGTRHVLENFRAPLRLGAEVFELGAIREESIDALVEFLSRFRQACEERNAIAIDTIATSAVRDAANREALIRQVRDGAGVDIRVISGSEEAFLLNRAVRSKVDLSHGRSLLLDLGGGSLEVALVEDGNLVSAESYRLGSVRLLKRLEGVESGGAEFLRLLEEYVRALEPRIRSHFDGRGRVDRAILTGGNAESIADLLLAANRAEDVEGVTHFHTDDLRTLVRRLADQSVEDRIAEHALKPDRADTIVPAGVVYRRIARTARVRKVLAPRVGMRDGILLELAARHLAHSTVADHREAILSASRALGRRTLFDQPHAETTRRLAVDLFDATREYHELSDEDRTLLESAALLHDIGAFISNARHHKHSWYLIRESEIAGLSDEERNLVALVARFHRKAHPQLKHEGMADLADSDRERVAKMAALLRVADSLDRAHRSKVMRVRVEIEAGKMTLIPDIDLTRGSLRLEALATRDKSSLFTELFGLEVVLRTEAPA